MTLYIFILNVYTYTYTNIHYYWRPFVTDLGNVDLWLPGLPVRLRRGLARPHAGGGHGARAAGAAVLLLLVSLELVTFYILIL